VRCARTVGAAALLMLSLLAGCTGDNHGKTVPSAAAETLSASGALQPKRQGPAPPIAGAVPGGTVTVFSPKGLPALDPTGAYSSDGVSVLSGLVTRSLTQYVYDPAHKSIVLVPDLATDLGRPNKDFTKWSFTIRDGVRYENGRKVTAADVAFGIERSLDRHDFPNGPPYSNAYFLDGKSYQGPYQSGTSYPGVTVAGNTVTLTMARPFPDMRYWAAFPAMGPIPELRSDPRTYGKHPLATGPYKVAKSSPTSLTLVRNAQWDPDTDPGRHAYPDRYVFHFNPNSNSPSKSHAMMAKADATILGSSSIGRTALELFGSLPEDYPKARRLHRVTLVTGLCSRMVFPDNQKIRDVRVREAIGFAFPYRVVARLSGDIPGVTVLRPTSMLPPGFPGRRDYTILGQAPGTTDWRMSRALLKRAGYSPGQYSLSWPYDASDPDAVRTMQALTRALERGGFTAKPFATSSKTLDRVKADPNAPVNLRFGEWCSDWPSGTSWFPELFGSAASFAASNGLNFHEPSVDREMQRIARLPFTQQPDAWGALGTTLMTKYYPVIPVSDGAFAVLHGSRLRGVKPDYTYYMPNWKDLDVRR
jgi:peptide/nickel transport system substrate-binding protein